MKRVLFFAILAFAICLPCFYGPALWALDYGGLLKAELDIAGADETDTGVSVILAPWVSLPLGGGHLHISAGLNMSIADETYAAPELFRLEYTTHLTPELSLRAGRFNWADPSGFVAKGRFDGGDVQYELGEITLGAAVLYTGLLFRDTADINVSPTDMQGGVFDWGDFVDTYFAPRRLLASVYGELPGYPSGRGHLYAGLLAQFDLSDADEAFHTQYLVARHTLAFGEFDIDAAGAAGLEKTKADGVRPSFAFSLEGGWQTPAPLKDRLSLGLAWASGDGSFTGAFFPVTTEARGYALKPLLSGMMIIKARYKARVLPELSGELGVRYFIRTDSTSFSDPYLEDDSYPLGAELDAGVLWVPFSDLSVSLKGGFFLPKTGSAYSDDAPVLWRITLGTVFSF